MIETELTTQETFLQDEQPLLEVKDLKQYFPIKAGLMQHVVGYVKAVDGVSFTIKRGHTLGLVGESGCGKTTIGKTILRLNEKTSGQVLFEGIDVFALNHEDLTKLRPKMQLISRTRIPAYPRACRSSDDRRGSSTRT